MTKAPRFTLNRSLVILRHKQPFLDWLTSIDPDPTLTLANIEDDSDAFLIPGDQFINSESDAVKWVESRWAELFSHMLNSWVTETDTWPNNRTLPMFRNWFGVEYHSMLWDLAVTAFEVEEWCEDNDPPELIH
jgi:hypothetical protein